ncbi:C40 family peptidase [Candidatus Protochlamydia phocaeensis]|uniref:C40 family peptidase n=1 Tax=Candidatus Protochlamydia phocaeensis TaxID=1414722 RepID=UPI000838E99E|nr:C40 family peptidase [Candidatus Protochlamydia phocaeensis]
MKKFVSYPAANLYVRPSEDSEVVSQALYGWQVNVLDRQEGFERIQTEDGYQGWIASDQLHALAESCSFASKVQIRHNAAHVYAEPFVNRKKPLLTLPFEVELNVVTESPEEDFRWIQVQLVTGQPAWIQRGHVRVDPAPLSLREMLDLSRQFLGLPYTWGGRSSFGYDCSGFIQMLFKQMGILLPRDARQQIEAPMCQEVQGELQPGDLIFFGSSLSQIKHVALYLEQDRLIHASVKPIPIVQVSSLDEPSLKQRFAYRTFRRLNLKANPHTYS